MVPSLPPSSSSSKLAHKPAHHLVSLCPGGNVLPQSGKLLARHPTKAKRGNADNQQIHSRYHSKHRSAVTLHSRKAQDGHKQIKPGTTPHTRHQTKPKENAQPHFASKLPRRRLAANHPM